VRDGDTGRRWVQVRSTTPDVRTPTILVDERALPELKALQERESFQRASEKAEAEGERRMQEGAT
jgi:hypothetical protein